MRVIGAVIMASSLLTASCRSSSTAPEPDLRVRAVMGDYVLTEFEGELLPVLMNTFVGPLGIQCSTTLVSGSLTLRSTLDYEQRLQLKEECTDGILDGIREAVEEGVFWIEGDLVQFSFLNPFETVSTRTAHVDEGQLRFINKGDSDPPVFYMVFEKEGP